MQRYIIDNPGEKLTMQCYIVDNPGEKLTMQRYIVDNPGGGMTMQGRFFVDSLVETIKQRTFNMILPGLPGCWDFYPGARRAFFPLFF